jgi:hypothetical protein
MNLGKVYNAFFNIYASMTTVQKFALAVGFMAMTNEP